MNINVSFDQSLSSLPAAFVGAINYVVAYFDSIFTNNVTVNIAVGYGEVAGQSLGSGDLGESEGMYDEVSYASATAALKQNAQSTLQSGAYATLPSSTPFVGDALYMTTAEQKALGLLAANDSAIDGYVGFSSSVNYSYSATATPGASQYYFIGIAEHEISEVLGRTSYLGETSGNVATYSVMDLFRYSGPGVRDLTARPFSNTAYFSINGGQTNIDSWNTNPSGDLGDWSSSAGADSFLAFTSPGAIDAYSAADNELMQTLGWDTAAGPVATVIQTDGATTLYEDAAKYYVELGGSSFSLTYGGAAALVGEFGDWAPVSAVATSSGYDVAWKNASDDDFTVWNVNSAGAYVSSPCGAVAATSYTLEAIESTFGQDLNGDGVIGVKDVVLQTDGSTDLAQVGANYALFAHGSTTGPVLSYDGAAVTSGEFGAWAPVGAVATGSGYDVAWKNASDDDFTVWSVNSSGAYVSSPFGAVAGASYALETIEPTFGQDLNGDGVIGLKETVLQTDGSTDLAQVGVNYALFAHGSTTGPVLSYDGAAVSSGEFGAWAPIGAVATGSGYDVAWKNASDDDFTVWSVDASGNYVGDIFGALAPTSVATESFETLFNQDLNGDGTLGLNQSGVASDGVTNLTKVGADYEFVASGASTGPVLSYAGSPVTAGEFGGWTPLGAEQLSTGGYEVAWGMAGVNEFTIWKTNSSGAYVSTLVGATGGASLV